MGFEVERTVYRLRFDDEKLAGFEVDVAAMSVREMFAYNDAVQEADGADARMRVMVDTLGRQLISWNAQQLGQPLPPTRDGLLELDDHYVSPLITGWLQAIRGAQAEPEPDPTGQAQPLAGLPMQPIADANGNVPAPAG